MFLARTLSDPFGVDVERLRRGRYGVIEVRDGRLAAIHLRRWPKIVSVVEIEWSGSRLHERTAGDRCWLYYNQPWRHPTFLAVTYFVSHADCRFVTFRRALEVLDEVARVKRTDAIVCDVWNLRISDRVLARFGWEPHKPGRWHRHHIKRFYGQYPPPRGESPAVHVEMADAGTLTPA